MVHSYWQQEINLKKIDYPCAVTEQKSQNLMMSAPEWWKCILRGPDFKIIPLKLASKSEFFPSPPTPNLMSPT